MLDIDVTLRKKDLRHFAEAHNAGKIFIPDMLILYAYMY